MAPLTFWGQFVAARYPPHSNATAARTALPASPQLADQAVHEERRQHVHQYEVPVDPTELDMSVLPFSEFIGMG